MKNTLRLEEIENNAVILNGVSPRAKAAGETQ